MSLAAIDVLRSSWCHSRHSYTVGAGAYPVVKGSRAAFSHPVGTDGQQLCVTPHQEYEHLLQQQRSVRHETMSLARRYMTIPSAGDSMLACIKRTTMFYLVAGDIDVDIVF